MVASCFVGACAGAVCSPGNCAGCCGDGNVCHTAQPDDYACGLDGGVCKRCPAGKHCTISGTCQ